MKHFYEINRESKLPFLSFSNKQVFLWHYESSFVVLPESLHPVEANE